MLSMCSLRTDCSRPLPGYTNPRKVAVAVTCSGCGCDGADIAALPSPCSSVLSASDLAGVELKGGYDCLMHSAQLEANIFLRPAYKRNIVASAGNDKSARTNVIWSYTHNMQGLPQKNTWACACLSDVLRTCTTFSSRLLRF